MIKQTVIQLIICLGIMSKVSAADVNNSFIKAITLEKRKEITVETHTEELTYDTAFDVPVRYDEVESYAQKHHLSVTIKTYKKPDSGSGCAHSPACVIILPFAILDSFSGDTVNVVTFSDDNGQLMLAEYETPLNLLSKLETKARVTPSIKTKTSKALKRIYINHFDKENQTRVINELYQALPKFIEDKQLLAFNSDIISISWDDDPNWGKNAFENAVRELEKTTIYNDKQQTSLVNLACDIASKYKQYQDELPQDWLSEGGKRSLLSSSFGITTLRASQAVLSCVATEKNFTTNQQQEIQRLLKVQVDGLCNDKSIPDEDWQRLINKFFSVYFSVGTIDVLGCDSRLFQIYHRWYQEEKITQADYEYLANKHPIKSEYLRNILTISDPNVLPARLALSIDKKYNALNLVRELNKQKPTLDLQISQQLAYLYSINLYEIDSMALLPDSDDDIDKQAEILFLLADLPEEVKQQLKIVKLTEPYAKAAWDIVINNKTPTDIIALLTSSKASKSNINTPFRVSDQVNELGQPKYSDLIWFALHLNPILGMSIKNQYQIAKEQQKRNSPSWLDKSRSWLDSVETKINID